MYARDDNACTAPQGSPRPWRRQAASVWLLALVVGAAPTAATQAWAEPGPDLVGYHATATVDGVRQTLRADDYLIADELVDLGAPTAQAVLDGTGDSAAYAALPDPGELLRTAPGLAAIATGGPVLPEYPLAVSSRHPSTPQSDLSGPGFSLSATAADLRSDATASFGLSDPGSTVASIHASAGTEVDPGLLRTRSVAASESEAVSVAGGLLRIAHVQSRASAEQTESGPVVRDGAFVIVGATVMGQPVTIDRNGVSLADSAIPLSPGTVAPGDALAGAGVRIRYLDAVETPDGVISAGLEISQVLHLPNAGVPAELVTVFGRAAAFVTGPSAVPSHGAGREPVAPETAVAAQPATGDAQDASPRPVSVPAPPPVGSPGDTARASVLAETPSLTDRSLVAFYLILVGAAASVLGGGSLFRWIAVRSPWNR